MVGDKREKVDELAKNELKSVIGRLKENEEDYSLNFVDVPHMLVCGYSGAGKTTLVQKIIVNLIRKYGIQKISVAIYDSKCLDYSSFRLLPNLILKTTLNDNDEKIVNFFAGLAEISDNRLSLLSSKHVNNIEDYNKYNEQRLAHIFVIIDDFINLNLDNETLNLLMRSLADGRSAGIHYFIVSSSISNRTMKEILFNISCRIAFTVASKADSKLILDSYGAERLYFPGDYILKFNNWQKKLTSYNVSPEVIDKTIQDIKCGSLETIPSINDLVGVDAKILENEKYHIDLSVFDSAGLANVEDDPLFNEVKDYVVEVRKASTSLLQKRFGIGYNRAARMIDLLEQNGVIGPAQGSKPREVYLKKEADI